LASLHTLSAIPDTTVSQYLLLQWASLTPDVQDEALNSFLADTMRIALLLDAIEAGTVQPASVGWNRSVRLMAQPNLRLRAKSRMLLTKEEEERQTVNKAYQQALTLNGNAEKGKKVFLQHCSSCHQVRGTLGVHFGPDLGTIHNWSADAIMANILAPNLSISSGYDLWSVELNSKESFQGVISSETASAITLVNAGRETRTINRKDIKSLKALNMSSMPAGLEKQINQQQMAHLLAYLKQNK
jgi:putative heme-binding domain-containing protein